MAMLPIYTLDENREPQPCGDLLTWSEWIQANYDARIVGVTRRLNGVCISTIFLGVGPLLFETAIFNSSGKITSVTRYRNWEAASEGHDEVVKEFDAKYPELKESP